MTDTTSRDAVSTPHGVLAGGFAGLRIFFGLIVLSNGIAKLIEKSQYDWGFISFNLISKTSARDIATGAADSTSIAPLRTIYQEFVLANWGFFGWFLTAAELLVGIALLLGIATRGAALVQLALIGPIWVMLIDTGQYLWLYPVDLVPLALLAVVPAGRTAGLDGRLAARFGGRWPF